MLLTFYPFFVNSILMCDVWGFFAFTDFTILKGKSLYWEVHSVLSISPLLSPCIFVLFTLLSCPGLWNILKCYILMFVKSPICVTFSTLFYIFWTRFVDTSETSGQIRASGLKGKIGKPALWNFEEDLSTHVPHLAEGLGLNKSQCNAWTTVEKSQWRTLIFVYY